MRFSASLAALIVATCSAAPAFAQSAATTPKPAAAPTSSYVYAVAVQNGQTCNAPNAADISIVQSVVNSQLRTISPVSDMLPRDASAAPADPLTAAIAELRTRAKSQGNATQKGFPLLYKHNVVVTTLCRNGELDQITSTGYVLIASVDEKIDLSDPAKLVPTVQAGNTITGSLAAVQGADWSNIYGDTKPKNVPFLPVFGDNADVVNGQLEQRLPLVAPKDPTNIVDLCNSSTYHLVVAGQGSLASQALDPYRTVLGVGTTLFTQPAPWGAAYKALGAAMALVGIPTSQEIKADVFFCDDDGLYSFGSRDQTQGAFDITGHTRRLAVTADTGTKNAVLAYALNDLQNQLDCIIYRWAQYQHAKSSIYPAPPFSRIGQSAWCGQKDKIKGYYDALWDPTDTTHSLIPIPK